jgi:hypothetical protein
MATAPEQESAAATVAAGAAGTTVADPASVASVVSSRPTATVAIEDASISSGGPILEESSPLG